MATKISHAAFLTILRLVAEVFHSSSMKMKAVAGISKYFSGAADWCSGRWWIVRLPLLLYLAYAGVRYLSDPLYSGWFGGITFGIHELGHFVFAFGDFLRVAGGTIAQVGAPLAAAYVLHRQRDYFGVAVCVAWLGFSLFEASTYMADARARELTLAAPGVGVVDAGDESVGHDWAYMFTELGVLQYDTFIAGLTKGIAALIWLGSIIFGGWLLLRMALHHRITGDSAELARITEAEKLKRQFDAIQKAEKTALGHGGPEEHD